ncbi:hypothetical protein GUITHDRAFT_111490 [Guillardia theta CCMP2712]|uniref:EF-hand domain-containing protein n=1 Tax=Guillardia theta (strain CCMP2712) TaxID=905079 RepID=L1J300_GUITC|nr:hypothetical protein GUITHDRAFT_111490 [Guillardia theta CCMP2712]EKX42514.1 hypothetical protein GUITHDRAFT_111490 [Guillardia theta CCMP2712]|eukprot:XP_005829494.1 hypothetical protein GUITHDRAFT_111490 [Guillardia theta CCMP2712]
MLCCIDSCWPAEECEKGKLDDKTKKKIRDGCVLLRDAYEGRASHGLYSLLKGPAYKRALFIIHTHPMWMNVVIWASIIHASLIIWEPPNRLSSWLDPTLDPIPIIILEVLCMGVFVADIVFKMLYFGDEKVSGWQDYISKEWQRNYMTIIFLFHVDFVLYHTKLCPFRFARPFRLTVLAARHRDVRRLISFFPTMCVKLVTVFFLPLLGVLAFFSILCVRIYGRLPAEHSLDLGEDSFSSVMPAIRTLFLLSTIDNFDPVVTEAYKQHPVSFFFFLAFIVFASFFLMSVALGVMFDLYLEDHEKTVKAEAKKEEKSMAKAFQKLDVEEQGKIKWLHFREMLVHLRPKDRNVKHDIAIFKELTRDMILRGEEPHINSTNFRDIKGFLPYETAKPASSLQKFTEFWEYIIISVDSILILSGMDSMKVNGIKLGTIFLSFFIWHLIVLVIFDFSFARKYWNVDWRRGDSIILLISVVCHAWVNFKCQSCRPSFKCLLEAVAVIRIFRPVLHNRESRQYMLAVLGVGPVLLHFGLLVATFNYMFSVIAMEMFALDPVTTTGPEGTRLLLACDKELPNFNCFSTGSLSIFMVFIEAGFGVVAARSCMRDKLKSLFPRSTPCKRLGSTSTLSWSMR